VVTETRLPAATLPLALVVLSAAAGIRGDGFAGRAIDVFATAVFVILAWIDLERRIVPNVIVLPAALVTLVARILVEPSDWAVLLAASLGAAAFFLIAHAIYPVGLGMGDVKLALLIGAAAGKHIFVALGVGTGAAGVYSLALLARHGAGARKTALPFAPFLGFGAVAVLIVY
jgi:leader peptidase (prepilin peptidase)/N-methyltransferase